MSTTAQINDSLKLGSAMLGEIGDVGRPAQGAGASRPASRCSRRPTSPAILVETAFICNPEEEAKLRSGELPEASAMP